MFGNYIEAKLSEFNKDTGKPIYSLDELLRPPTPPDQQGFDDEDMGDILDELAPFLGKSGVNIIEART